MEQSEFKKNHSKIFVEPDEIKDVLRLMNDRINGCGFYFKADIRDDYGYVAYKKEEVPENSLFILASFDFAYYHDLEIVFYDVIFYDVPEDDEIWNDHWQKDQLELNEDAGSHLKFVFNRGTEDIQYTIHARGFSYYFGTVHYKKRAANEPLKDGERVATWLR